MTPLGDEDVFDLTEHATSHFVANGLVVHNCSEFSFLNDTSCNLASAQPHEVRAARTASSTSRRTATPAA